jgi:methylenetetrahydrofolate dehydrogenase (NADP+) / methenyltetrahydrofolate cyclohydrolase
VTAGAVEAEPTLLVGSPIAKEIRARLRDEMGAFTTANGRPPTLVVVFVGRDAPSAVYLQQILKSCENVGALGRVVQLQEGCTKDELRQEIERLNGDPTVDGIIVQMPLPAGIPLRAVIDAIDPAKDIDGLHPENAGLLAEGYDGFLPATAQAAVEILKRSGIDIQGKHAVVVGRSNVVGKPAALLLLREHATVTICHSRTVDLASHTRTADIVIVAAGVPGLITGAMLKPGASVVDVGINVVDDGIVGDVDFASARLVAGAISPVPGGVGPLTNAILMQHLLDAAKGQRARSGG